MSRPATRAASRLADRGYGTVETVTAKEETLLFELPRELRKDIAK